jgi:hypothetical protein
MRKFIPSLASVAVLSLALTGLSTVAAQAAPDHVKPLHLVKGITIHATAVRTGSPKITIPHSKRGIGKLGTGNLLYHGGPIQQTPKVFVLFWGSWWNSTCSNTQGNGVTDENYLYSFYNGLGGTSDNLAPVSGQYGDSTGKFPNFPAKAFVTWNADCTDPPASATDAQLAAEAVGYASTLAGEGYTINNNTQIVVVSPSGTNPGGGFGSTYCAYHNWAQYSSTQLLSWTNLPYIPDQGANCGANLVQNAEDGWSIVGGHEYEESVTDPFVNNQSAWYDSSGYEIGDKCAWTSLFAQKLSTGTFAMQPEWDNRTSACQAAFTYPRGRIKLSANKGLCLQGTLTNGSAVTLFSPCDTNRQRTWVAYPDGSLRRWESTGKCIYPKGGSSANGTPLVIASCTGRTIQKWTWSSATSEWTNGYSHKCIRASSEANGAALVENTCGLTGGTEKFTNV